MMKLILAAYFMIAGIACKSNSYRSDEQARQSSYERDMVSDSHQSSQNADNTGMNKRDAEGATLTPMDQSKGSATDLKMTAKIREMVTDEDTLSAQAQNVKIITLQGLTTLRGPVETMNEKNKIEQLARRAGAKRIDNQLEVTTKTE